jgi:uncharacterized membrane protein YeaQ/YmgE (transglycosylase-associated protein family)
LHRGVFGDILDLRAPADSMLATHSAGWIASFVGAFILLLIYLLVKRKTA